MNRTLIFLLFGGLYLYSFAASVDPISVTLGATSASYTTSCGSYTYFKVEMTDPCKDLVVSVKPSSGEPNIYISKTQTNPTKESMSWAAFAYGSYSVSISHWNPDSSPGWYYISIYGDCTAQSLASSYTLTTSAEAIDDGSDIYLHSGQSQDISIKGGAYKNFRFCMPPHTDTTVDSGVSFIGGTQDASSVVLIISAVTSGTLMKGMTISGVGIVGPCKILDCSHAATYVAGTPPTEDYTAPVDHSTRLRCILDSRQKLPGPTYYKITATNSNSATMDFLVTNGVATPSALMSAYGFSSTAPTTPILIQGCSSSTTCTLGAKVTTTLNNEGSMGLAMRGIIVGSNGNPNFANPAVMASMRGKTSVKGDACMDVLISWKMTTSDGVTKYPDVLLSRTDPSPMTEEYVWRRSDYNAYGSTLISHNELTARDNNGYLSGSWYLSVYGYCSYSTSADRGTSTRYINDDDAGYSGKCRTNDADAKVTVSISFIPRATSLCSAVQAVTTVVPAYTLLTSGVTVNDEVQPGLYKEYKIRNPNPCNSMKVMVTTQYTMTGTGGGAVKTYDLKNTAAEPVIGKWPNIAPTLSTLAWGSYSSYSGNFTIDAWDPSFDGANTCGADGRSECWYFIRVLGYDATGGYSAIGFDLTITLVTEKKIYGVPQLTQFVTAGGTNKYKFCVNPDETPSFSTVIDMFSFTDSCTCPETYTDLELTVSKELPEATINDNVWRIGHGAKAKSGVSTLNLMASDIDTRVGTYYLSVTGWCTSAAWCKNSCKCAPCSNLPDSPYAVSVRNYGTSYSNPQQSCAPYESYAAYGQAQCCVNELAKITQIDKDLSKTAMTANAAISMVSLTWLCTLIGILYYGFTYFRGILFPHHALPRQEHHGWKDADIELSAAPVVQRLSDHGGTFANAGRLSGHGAPRV